MKSLATFDSSNHANLFDYDIVDQNKESLGTLHGMWTNRESGQLEFLGLKTGWLFGSNHVVPAGKAQVDEANHTILIPYTLALVKGAPAIDADAEITDAQEAEIFRYYGGARTVAAPPLAAAETTTTATTGDTVREAKTGDAIEVPLTEEQVKVGKRTVDAGTVRLRKVIRTEIVNQPVEIRREDIVVERIPADQVRAGAKASEFKDETINVPLTREEVVVAKEAHVTGGMRLKKTADTETQHVSETVRKEDVEVIRDGKIQVQPDERVSR